MGANLSAARYNACSRSRGVAQPGSASAWGAEGRRFKSGRPDQFAVRRHPGSYETPQECGVFRCLASALMGAPTSRFRGRPDWTCGDSVMKRCASCEGARHCKLADGRLQCRDYGQHLSLAPVRDSVRRALRASRAIFDTGPQTHFGAEGAGNCRFDGRRPWASAGRSAAAVPESRGPSTGTKCGRAGQNRTCRRQAGRNACASW